MTINFTSAVGTIHSAKNYINAEEFRPLATFVRNGGMANRSYGYSLLYPVRTNTLTNFFTDLALPGVSRIWNVETTFKNKMINIIFKGACSVPLLMIDLSTIIVRIFTAVSRYYENKSLEQKIPPFFHRQGLATDEVVKAHISINEDVKEEFPADPEEKWGSVTESRRLTENSDYKVNLIEMPASFF